MTWPRVLSISTFSLRPTSATRAATAQEGALRGMMSRPHLYPVSVKGVVISEGRVLLLRNERNEWELPGGKLELGEDPARCVEREIAEESGWSVSAGPLIDAWQYHLAAGADVLILTYGCHTGTRLDEPVVSAEHSRAGLFAVTAVRDLTMPDGYKDSVAAWSRHAARQD